MSVSNQYDDYYGVQDYPTNDDVSLFSLLFEYFGVIQTPKDNSNIGESLCNRLCLLLFASFSASLRQMRVQGGLPVRMRAAISYSECLLQSANRVSPPM